MNWKQNLTLKAGIVLAGILLMLSHAGLNGPKHLARARPQAQAGTAVIADGTFNPADWSVQVVSPFGTSQTNQQVLTGGNPGTFRSMAHILPPPAGPELVRIEVSHLYQAQSYDPQVQGAISSIDYQEDTRLLSLPWPQAFIRSLLLLRQDGRLYRSNSYLQVVGNLTWQGGSLTNLQANDFVALDGSEARPNFSAAGSPIQFGFWRGSSRLATQPPFPANQTLEIEHAIDNWQVTINQDPSPNRAPEATNDFFVVEVLTLGAFGLLGNDSDPDGDPISIQSITAPSHGEFVAQYADYVVFLHGTSIFDSFTYTITDGQLTDTAGVSVVLDCGCTTKCLNFILGSGSGNLAAQEDTIDLDLLYRLRNQVMKPTVDGRRYVEMYYTTTPEIARLLIVDQPTLGDEAVDLVELWQDNLYSLVDGDGSAVITQEQVDAIETFLANLSAAGSAELQHLITDELTRLGPLDDYVGLTVKAAKSRAIGDPVLYLPVVLK